MSAVYEPLARACAALREAGLDGALLASPSNVTYVSGWEAPLIVGPFADIVERAPVAYAVVSAREETARLVVADVYGGNAARGSRIGAPETFGTLGMVDPVDHVAELTGALRRTLARAAACPPTATPPRGSRSSAARCRSPCSPTLGLPLDAPDAGPRAGAGAPDQDRGGDRAAALRRAGRRRRPPEACWSWRRPPPAPPSWSCGAR